MSLLDEIREYVEAHIIEFHDKKVKRLDDLKLKDVLKRKNPYLFKAKNMESATDIVKAIMEAYVSSQEETIFGDWLEDLAVFVCNRVYGGVKSTAPGIDLEFEKDGARYLVSIKSGPNWGNKSQIEKLKQDFESAIVRLRGRVKDIRCVNGCCYGRCHNDYGVYVKICGQEFWELISGDPNLYTEIIEPLGYKAQEKTEEYLAKFNAKLNLFVSAFVDEFCFEDGKINWEKLVRFNSGKK